MRSLAVVRRMLTISAPPRGRLTLATLLGAAAAAATIGLLAGSGYLVGKAALRPGLGAIAGILAIVEVVAILRAPLRYGERLVGHDAAFRALTRWRVWLYDCLEPLSPAGLRAWHSGDLLARATDDVDALQDLYLRGLVPLVVAVAASGLAVTIEALLLPSAGVILGVCLLVALVGPPALVLTTGAAAAEGSARRGDVSADVVDLLQGAADLLAFGQEEALLARIEAADRGASALARRRALFSGAATALLSLCLAGAVLGVLVVAIVAVHHHHLAPVMLAVLPLAAIGAFEALPPVTMAAARLGDVVGAGRRLLELEGTAPPVVDPPRPRHVPPGVPAVNVHDAYLRYAEDLPWTLRGVSLEIPPGARLAVVGPSGAGKSSLVNVLLRFWPLQRGTATLAGVPLEDLAQGDVRGAVGLVEQDARLFAGTIAENVALGRPDAGANEVAEALSRAQLVDWVATLPEGAGTPVGEGGARVSGGQRQRIALARALLAQAPVLLLDEPTAGLDQPTAARLLADVLAAGPDRSVLLVTHRPDDLALFPDVVAMDAGAVVQRPTGRSTALETD